MKEVALFSKVIGTGEPLIILHGLFGSNENLARVAKELSTNFMVHCLDIRNHGRSPHSDEMSYEDLVKDLLVYMDQHKIESADFIGHSMGGKVAMSLALAHPNKVNELIVGDIAPVTYSPHHLEILEALESVDFNRDTTRNAVDQTL